MGTASDPKRPFADTLENDRFWRHAVYGSRVTIAVQATVG